MENKKITGIELKRALEICSNDENCGACFYYNNKDCRNRLMADTLDFINQQEIEMDLTRESNNSLRDYCGMLINKIDKYYLEVSEKNAEIRQLKAELDALKGGKER